MHSIPDILRHMADVIVQAEKEVFLATSTHHPLFALPESGV